MARKPEAATPSSEPGQVRVAALHNIQADGVSIAIGETGLVSAELVDELIDAGAAALVDGALVDPAPAAPEPSPAA